MPAWGEEDVRELAGEESQRRLQHRQLIRHVSREDDRVVNERLVAQALHPTHVLGIVRVYVAQHKHTRRDG